MVFGYQKSVAWGPTGATSVFLASVCMDVWRIPNPLQATLEQMKNLREPLEQNIEKHWLNKKKKKEDKQKQNKTNKKQEQNKKKQTNKKNKTKPNKQKAKTKQNQTNKKTKQNQTNKQTNNSMKKTPSGCSFDWSPADSTAFVPRTWDVLSKVAGRWS